MIAPLAETKDLSLLPELLMPGALLAFDLDNTLFEPTSMAGSTQWESDLTERYQAQGMSYKEAFNHSCNRWKDAQDHVQMRLLDPSVPKLLHTLRKNGVFVLGFTSREPHFKEITRRQLGDLNLHFSSITSLSGPGFFFDGQVIYSENHVRKGKIIGPFLEAHGWRPPHTVFIDDLLENVLQVTLALQERQHSCFGIRYSGADASLEAYDSKEARLEEASLLLR